MGFRDPVYEPGNLAWTSASGLWFGHLGQDLRIRPRFVRIPVSGLGFGSLGVDLSRTVGIRTSWLGFEQLGKRKLSQVRLLPARFAKPFATCMNASVLPLVWPCISLLETKRIRVSRTGN